MIYVMFRQQKRSKIVNTVTAWLPEKRTRNLFRSMWHLLCICRHRVRVLDGRKLVLLLIMAGAKFEYDESGSTYYFLLAFEALVIVPSSYYFYPRAASESKYFFNFIHTILILVGEICEMLLYACLWICCQFKLLY